MSRYVAVTGTRRNTRQGVISAALARANPTHIIVGDCPTGVDAEALAWAKANGVTPIVVHALWDWHRKNSGRPHGAGPQRNAAMAHLSQLVGAVECIAVPDEDSKGTHDCVNAHQRFGVKVRVLESRGYDITTLRFSVRKKEGA